MRKGLLILWRIWFYVLAAIPVIVFFIPIALFLVFPNGYRYVFWLARNVWAPFVLGGMGFWVKKTNAFPEEGKSFMLIANHTSFMDIMVILRLRKTPFVFVGKKELVKIPIFGYLYKRAAILVDRSDRKSRWAVYDRANQKLALGYSICIFPEVSYEDDTVFLNDFKRGAFKIAIEHQLPVVPMVFFDCKRKQPWYPRFGYPGELRVQTYPEILPPKTIEELEVLLAASRKVIDKGLRDDPKGHQFEAVALEKAIVKAAS